MAWARKSRYLICFYCGAKTQTKYDGTTREYGCRSCGSTNYLDENGDIADPPTATDFEAPAARFAVSSTAAPAASPDSIWCTTCLKNQRFFTTMLAQYQPETSSGRGGDELDANYYRYRKALEQRYPQACAACAEKADARIRQAGYVAKTDHLRRMMDRTRGRKAARTTTPLDWAHRAGRWLWWGGFLLQVLWHLRTAAEALEHNGNGLSDPDDQSWVALALTGFKRAMDVLPVADLLIKASIAASILSAWWNPHFVQVNRGFTRHLLGFTQWYSFQGLIVFFRFIFRNVLDVESTKTQKAEARLGAHVVMAGLMTLIYVAAGRSIKVDTTPLFKSNPVPIQAASVTTPPRPIPAAGDYTSSLHQALDEIESPTPTRTPGARSIAMTATPSARSSAMTATPSTTFNSPVLTRRQPVRPTTPIKTENGFDGLRLSDVMPKTPTDAGDVEEMDWVPTTSQHRAFSTSSPARPLARPFNEAPPLPDNNKPFWYRFPAVTPSPGQRRDNPRVTPFIMSKPEKKEETIFGTKKAAFQKQGGGSLDSGVVFKEPKFFAPERDADEANSLADLLNQSFSLGQAGSDESVTERMSVTSEQAPGSSAKTTSPGVSSARAVTSAILLAVWILASVAPFPYRTEGQLVVLCAAGVMAVNATGDTARFQRGGEAPGAAAYGDQTLGAAELAALCWVGWQTWARASSEDVAMGMGTGTNVGVYGAVALGTMLGHQLWNAVR